MPLTAGVLGALFLGERTRLYLFAGDGMILAGVTMINRRAAG